MLVYEWKGDFFDRNISLCVNISSMNYDYIYILTKEVIA